MKTICATEEILGVHVLGFKCVDSRDSGRVVVVVEIIELYLVQKGAFQQLQAM